MRDYFCFLLFRALLNRRIGRTVVLLPSTTTTFFLRLLVEYSFFVNLSLHKIHNRENKKWMLNCSIIIYESRSDDDDEVPSSSVSSDSEDSSPS